MTDEILKELEERLDALNSIAGLMKVVVGGAIAIGIWVGALQYQVNVATEMSATNQERVRMLEIHGATAEQKLENIYEVVRRIDAKLNK